MTGFACVNLLLLLAADVVTRGTMVTVKREVGGGGPGRCAAARAAQAKQMNT